MYSSLSKGIALLILILVTVCTSIAYATDKLFVRDELAFKVKPQHCVTLHQGRDCFATILVQWQKLTAQTLCLYHVKNKQSENKVKITCWTEKNEGQISVEFQSNETLRYQLRTLQDDVLLAEAEVAVSWLHNKTTKRRRWRLF